MWHSGLYLNTYAFIDGNSNSIYDFMNLAQVPGMLQSMPNV